jgi:2-dehydro-3-deoxy-D-gluconate 5-dehydrogenase
MSILGAFRLDGSVALVTGASTGLGQAIALAEAGADVVCHGNTHAPDATCEAVTKAGRKAFALIGDLGDRETPRQLTEKTIAHFGQLDILVNNAGTIRRAPATACSEEDWATVIEVNLSSVFRLAQLAGRHMIERGRGKILNLASLLSFQGGITVPA